MPTNTRAQWQTIEGQILKRDAIHPQTQSPLFGKCSPEIRNLIFQWALTAEEEMSNPQSYFRPGRGRVTHIATNLLLTCAAVYIETCHVVVKINEHVFCYDGHLNSSKKHYRDTQGYFDKMLTKQQRLDAISVHLHVDKMFLEQPGPRRVIHHPLFFGDLSKLPAMKHIQHLRISIGASSWNTPYYYLGRVTIVTYVSGHQSGQVNMVSSSSAQSVQANTSSPSPPVVEIPLALDLRVSGYVGLDKMQTLIQQAGHIPAEEDSFASHLLSLTSLQTLTIEFDTISLARPSLERLVNHARTWVFPRKAKGRGKSKVEEEMKVLDETETTEWKAFGEEQRQSWTSIAKTFLSASQRLEHESLIVDEATTMKLKWVVVRKEAVSEGAGEVMRGEL